MICDRVGVIRDPLKQDLAPEFYWNQKKSSVFKLKLTSIRIKYTIQAIIDWIQSFSLLYILIQKEYFFCFIWVLKVSLGLTLIQKRGLYPLRLLPLIRVLFVPLQGIAPESSWLGDAFLKDYKNICKIKMREMKTK